MRLDREAYRCLCEALMSAFEEAALRQMLRFECNKILDEIKRGDRYRDVIFDLVELAEREDWIDCLIRGALADNPDNPALKGFKENFASVVAAVSGDGVTAGPSLDSSNPFVCRSGIRDPQMFFNREREQGDIRNFLRVQGACQVVGPRRIGKSSLLLHVQHVATGKWDSQCAVAYVDLQDSRCETLSGWLRVVSRQWGWETVATTLSEFSERVEAMLQDEKRKPVLCLDEFEQFTTRPTEFTSAFFLNLRFCAGQGMAILTASGKPLKDLTNPGDPTSPFFNVFHLLRLDRFSEKDAEDFVNMPRPGVPSFTPEEREAILKFARCHPLALQVACYHVVEANQHGETLPTALHVAEDELRAMLPSW
jgi:uncharacterized protein